MRKVFSVLSRFHFIRNKVYIAMVAILFFIVGGYYVTKGAIGLARQKDYQPNNQFIIRIKYMPVLTRSAVCIVMALPGKVKHAAIPSVNVCMNCHKTITEYTKKVLNFMMKTVNEINGTAEIAKLYKYAGFDPKNPMHWDPSKAKPIEWVRIHNLPDHVYFNHSQHVKAGNVQCQTCHGDITAMDEVKQVSELSMGWCVNCHRETKVNFNYDSTKGINFIAFTRNSIMISKQVKWIV